MAINPTAQQLAKQTQITLIIDDLQAKLAAVTNKNDIEIAPDLFDLFAAFDINATKSITGTEITALTNHLATINTDANIVKIFDASGNPITANIQVDINKDGQLKATGTNNDLLALNTLLTAKTNNLVSFNKPQTIAALNATDKTLFQTLAAMPGVSDEDEDFFLLKIAGKPIDQRLKESYINIFNNGTATDEKITLLLDLVNHQATATAARQANSDYLDLFYLNFEAAANVNNSQTLVDILKSADSAKRTLYINSLNTISQNGDSQFLTNSVINDYKANSTLGDGLTAAEITKFNSFTVRAGVSDADRTNYYKMLLNNTNDTILSAFESMFDTGGKYSLNKSNLLSSLAGSNSLKIAGPDQTQFFATFNAMTDVSAAQSTAITNLINHQDTATSARKADSDYLDIFHKSLTSNINTANTLIDIIKAPDSATRTRYINSINAVSQNGDNQFLANTITADYRVNSTLGDGLDAAEITKFNAFTIKAGVSDADRTNYYRMLLANPNGVLLTAFENMFDTGGNYSLAKSNLLLTANSNANLRTAGTSQDYFLAAFSASSSATDATNINTITADTTNPTRANYVSSLATLYNNGQSSDVLRVLTDDIKGNVRIEIPMGVPELNKLQSFISRTNETNTDQNHYLKYVTMPLPDPWITSFENMFSTGTVNDTRRNVFDTASGNTTLKSTPKYNTMFLDLFNDPSKVNYASSLNLITTKTNPTKENYIDTLKAAADAGISDKIGAVLDRAIGITPAVLRLDNQLTAADFMKFQTLFTNGASTSQEDALFVALSRNADNDATNNVDSDIIDAYVNSFSNGTKSTVKTDIFKRATVNTAINTNGPLQDLYTKTYPGLDVSTTLAGYVLEVAENTSFTGVAPAEAPALRQRYIDSIAMINQNTGTVFQSSGLPEVITALNSNHKNNLNISRAMTQADINTFDTFTDRLSDQPIDRERFFKYLLVDKIADQGKPTQANYTNLWISNFDQMFAQNYANVNRSNLYDVAFNSASVSGSKKYTDMFFDMFKKPTNPPADPGYNYANTLANTSTGIASSTKVNATVKEVYIDNLKSSFEYGLSDGMAALLERQINASYVTNKVFSSTDLGKFKTLFDNGATTHQQDVLFKAISEGKDPDLIDAYVNSFIDKTITTDTTATLAPPATLPAGSTLKTELFKRAIATGSLINNDGNLQNLFLHAFNKTAGDKDKGSVYAQKILNVAETPNATFANNPQYIATLEKISTNLAVLAKDSGFEDAIDALSTNQANRRVISRAATDADLAKFDTFSARTNDAAIDRERFFRYLLTDVPTPLEAQWIDSFDKMFKDGYITSDRSNLFDDAFDNSATNSSEKYSNMFFSMISTPNNRGLNYAQSLNGSKVDNSGMVRSNNPSKETYIDNLKLAFDYNLPDKMVGVLDRHIKSGYTTSKTFSPEDLGKFKILFDKNATTQQQDLLFKAISEGKDPDLINAYVNSFIDGTITSDTDITTPPAPGYTPKTVLFERAIASSLTNNNGDLQNLFLFAYNNAGGKTSIQAEQLLNIIETPNATFPANPLYISSLENINKNLAIVAKGSGFEDIMNALAADQKNRINISRSLSNADIDKFDKFNDRSTDNPTDRERFIKYLLTDKIPGGQNLTTAWIDSFDKMFKDDYVSDNRRILFDKAYEQTSINSSAKYSNIFIEMFNRSANGYDYANSLVNTMVDSTNPSKDKYIDNLKKSADLAMPVSMISFLERHLNTGDVLNRTLTDTEFSEYRTLLNATATVPPTADNDDLDKLFKMHTLNPVNDSGIDNDLEAAFAKMFKDGTINIGKTPTTPSSKETLLDRFLPVSIAAEVPGQSKIDLVNKSINGKIVTAEQQQLDFLKYFNKDQYIDFSKELIIDNFMVSYQFPTKQQQITLYALSTLAPGGTETPAELAARTETLKKIQAPDLDPKLSSKERFTQFKTIFEGELQKADPTLAELIKANPELGNLKQAELLDNFILKIANTALNGLPLDKTTQEQKIIFAETMAAILKIDNSTAANVANGTANNIAQYYIPSLNNMLALNADEKLVKTLKRFAEAGRKFEGWMTAEDIEIFSEIGDSAYFQADETKYTDLYLEMALSLKSITVEEKERKDNFRTAFRDIFLFNYSVPIPPNGVLPPANLANFDAKLNILSSLIKGVPADDKLYSFKILKTPTNPKSFYEYGETYKNTDPTDTKDYSGIKLLKDDEEDILNYLSTLETGNYALSSLGLINSQRTATPSIKTGNSDVQLQDAKNNVNSVSFPTNLTDTEKAAEQAKYIANIDIIDNYAGVNGFDIDATSNKLNPGVVKLTASLLKLSTQLINFTGDAFNKPAQELEIAANYVLNSGNPLNDKLPDGTLLADKISNSINNWLNAPEQKNIYANNVLADNLTSLLKPIINDLKSTENPILTNALSTAVNSVAPGNISNSQLASKNLFTSNKEDLLTKKLSALSSIYKTGQSINTPITESDLSFMDKFEDIYQKYSIDNDVLYKNIITKFADPSTQTLVNNVLNKLIQEDNNQINTLSYSERRSGSKFVLDALNRILSDPTKSIIPGNDDKTRLANLEKSFNGNGNKLYPEAYNDIVNLLLNQQAAILDAKKPAINALPNTTDEEKEAKKKAMLELDTVRNSVQAIIDYPKNSLAQYFTKKGKTLGNQFNTKLNDFINLVTNEVTDSDMDLLKAYAERSIAGSSLTSNIKTLVEYDGKDGFKLNALPENLDDSTITTASKLIQLAKDLQQGTPSEADSILIKYLENTTNLILNSGGGNRNYLKDFINNTAFTQVESVLSASPRHVNINKGALENLLKPYEFINKGINNYDPELMTAYANLTKNNPSDEETLNRFESIITYQGSNSFRPNADQSILTLSAEDLKNTIDNAYDLINKADELSQIAEFVNSGLIGYLERNANLFLKNSLSEKEKTSIKNFTQAFMGSINTTLMNNDLTPSVINELLSSFSLDSESVVDGASLNYIPYSIQSAEAAVKRNAKGKLVLETVKDQKDNKDKLVYSDAINNAFFREKGFTKTVIVDNAKTIEVSKPTVKGQVLLYQALRTGVESLITLEKAKAEDQQDSTKISTLESSLASYNTMIDTLKSLT